LSFLFPVLSKSTEIGLDCEKTMHFLGLENYEVAYRCNIASITFIPITHWVPEADCLRFCEPIV